MPVDTVIVVTVVITAFVAFGLTLAWAHGRAH